MNYDRLKNDGLFLCMCVLAAMCAAEVYRGSGKIINIDSSKYVLE